ncbi:MAG TPA: N-acetyltransferase [Clostridia bacterium]|nr:N-acetyltransferase [Clostridia bacterium]
MIRLANEHDAEQLSSLNLAFNGQGETTIENIRMSIQQNQQEVVVIDEEDGLLVGFVCVQLKKSFCYDGYMPEITEVYVDPAYRRRGIASRMILFAEDCCADNYPLHKMELLTGVKNLAAQNTYRKLGYCADGEIHLSKKI